MISNLKYDIEFRRDKALELSNQVEQHMAAGASPDPSPLKSIRYLPNDPQRSIPEPSSSAAGPPSVRPSARHCGNSRRHYEQAQAA